MQNTSFALKLTHDSANTNFFHKSKRQIAGSGLLEKIKFVQWRISEKIQENTDNINVIRLAALLAVFPRMGIFAFEFSHAHLAKRFGDLYNIPSPSRKSICTWEKALSNMGLIDIPRHKASKPKTRVFTKKFWDMSRERMPKMSYLSVPVTWYPANEETQVNTTQDLTRTIETKKRAIDIDHNNSIQHTRAPSRIKKISRPPKHKGDVPKGLDAFENSVAWWLFQNKNRGSYRNACLIFAEFLRMADSGDGYFLQLQRAWKDCRDSERPGLVSDLIRNLRPSMALPDLPGGRAHHQAPVRAPLRIVPPDSFDLPAAEKQSDPEIAKLRIAMVFGGEYTGRYPERLREYQRSTDARREQILNSLTDF